FTNGSSVVKQPLSVSVWPFALPDDLPITLYANFCYRPDWFARYGVTPSALHDRVSTAYLAALRAYKINAVGLAYYPFPGNTVASGAATISAFPDLTKILDTVVRYGFRFFRLPELADAYDATQLGQPGNLFAFNGPVYYQYPQVQEGYDLVKSAVPPIATLCTGGPPDPSLTNSVDIWAMYSRTYNPQAHAAACSQGQQCWLYAHRLHGAKRWPTNQRIIGWHLFNYNFSGYLLWSVNWFAPDPWTAQPDVNSGNRAGTWIYPHPATGMPLPTLRLEALRRGFEDYQYFVLFQQAYQNGKISAAAYNGIRQRIASATSRLTTDSMPYYWKDFESVRQDVGNLLKSAR
ncbi:MAG: DUF4091 domain-containing protein, partial [Deltaproteobacteria bacterium]|nr:DUF4091 domain-containing protein [Deltaproteobacteria bacterium]